MPCCSTRSTHFPKSYLRNSENVSSRYQKQLSNTAQLLLRHLGGTGGTPALQPCYDWADGWNSGWNSGWNRAEQGGTANTREQNLRFFCSVYDFQPIFIGVLFAQAIISAFLCHSLSTDKGYASSWFGVGLFFGIFGLIAAAGLPDLKSQKYLRLIAESHGAFGDAPRNQ